MDRTEDESLGPAVGAPSGSLAGVSPVSLMVLFVCLCFKYGCEHAKTIAVLLRLAVVCAGHPRHIVCEGAPCPPRFPGAGSEQMKMGALWDMLGILGLLLHAHSSWGLLSLWKALPNPHLQA